MDKELVNHPDHYNVPGKRECIVAMQEDYGDAITAVFCLTNAYKYLYRAGLKEGSSKDQDIAKAVWYYNYAVNNTVINNSDPGLDKLLSYLTDNLSKEDN